MAWEDGLDDFEKTLADTKVQETHSRKRQKHHHHHRHHADLKSGGEYRKRSAHHPRDSDKESESRRTQEEETVKGVEPAGEGQVLHRDSWMVAPSALDIAYTQKDVRKQSQPPDSASTKADFELNIHKNEINKHHLQILADGKNIPENVMNEPSQRKANYTFGDAGSQWRMTNLKAVYRVAEETGRPVDNVAKERFGDLRDFDDAREELTELERRETYGEGYVGKEKPSGELFQERKLEMDVRRKHSREDDDSVSEEEINRIGETEPVPIKTVPVDPTSLNRLKAQLLKAQLRGSSEAARLQAEYDSAISARSEPGVVTLGTMQNRMLVGGRNGEVKNIDNTRGRERGLVEENEDMSIEDMVREERRTRGQVGGEGLRLAERIAKDGKFDNDLDYMDENANKLAKRVHKSEINLRNIAVSDYHKMNRILDNCPLCHHEDTNTPPTAPIVSLATRVYLTLPTEPEISDGGACIIPIQHRGNLLECDDDEWEEIRNFMKSLIRMYHDQGRDVIFYENATSPQKHRHAGMEVVPLPYALGETAPAFFKEAILTADEEWTQHKKIIDTLAKARSGLGKLGFRRTIVKESPYFHVWFELDGGLGHIVEDANRWPKGDLFAREIIGGMLDKGPEIIKKQGRWNRGDGRVDGFRKRWKKFDWTRVLTDS